MTKFNVGDVVRHYQFGRGVVTGVNPEDSLCMYKWQADKVSQLTADMNDNNYWWTERVFESDWNLIKKAQEEITMTKQERMNSDKEVYIEQLGDFLTVGDVLIWTQGDWKGEKDTIVEIDTRKNNIGCSVKLLKHGWVCDNRFHESDRDLEVYEYVARPWLFDKLQVDAGEIITGTIKAEDLMDDEPLLNLTFDLDNDDEDVAHIEVYDDGSALLTFINDAEDAVDAVEEILVALSPVSIQKLHKALGTALEVSELTK